MVLLKGLVRGSFARVGVLNKRGVIGCVEIEWMDVTVVPGTGHDMVGLWNP